MKLNRNARWILIVLLAILLPASAWARGGSFGGGGRSFGGGGHSSSSFRSSGSHGSPSRGGGFKMPSFKMPSFFHRNAPAPTVAPPRVITPPAPPTVSTPRPVTAPSLSTSPRSIGGNASSSSAFSSPPSKVAPSSGASSPEPTRGIAATATQSPALAVPGPTHQSPRNGAFSEGARTIGGSAKSPSAFQSGSRKIAAPPPPAPAYTGRFRTASEAPTFAGGATDSRTVLVDRRPVFERHYGGWSDYSYRRWEPYHPWYYGWFFHPAYYYDPPLLVRGSLYPSPFNMGRFILTLVVTGLVIAGIVWAVRAFLRRKELQDRFYQRGEA